MRIVPLTVCLALCSVADAAAQGGGRGRGRAEEITNRVGVFFTDVTAPPATDGTTVDLAGTDLVRAGAGAGQPTVLYLVDGTVDVDVREQFERTLFADDDLGILLRCFHCGRIDLKDHAALAAKHGKQAPLFVVFDTNGNGGDVVAMAGFKASAKALETQLTKAAKGLVKPSIAAFVKDYRDVVRDLEQLLAKKKNATERQAKAGDDDTKHAELGRDLAVLAAAEQKLLERERQLLSRLELPVRPDAARRLGGRGQGGGGAGGGPRGGGERGGGGDGSGRGGAARGA